MAMASNTTSVVADVLTVRERVELSASSMFSRMSRFGYSVLYSRILSKITTVSFSEYPIIVSTAAINCWSTSKVKGRIPVKIEKKAITNTVLNTSEIKPPVPHVQLRKRSAMYVKMAKQESNMAMMASRLISLATVGPTFSELMIPLGLSMVDKKSWNFMGVR